ncbi:hypothetical protein OB919_16065 [Halobacteria archaeon AArc-curdl1]|uniref:Uncharacterized protein n=1 Tax=Natronosalvus hydrolyticus TaxID=2979988 RepID=A0AAP2ZA11_9EURY|nr:hypothetical protein [Halobacteria archaeon AArc-curdl1]
MASKDFVDIKVSNEEDTVGLVELIAENVKEGISARIDFDLLKEAIELAEAVDDGITAQNEKDIHLIKGSDNVVHLYITRSGETDSGIIVAGKSDYPTPDFNSEPKGENR